jgi:predicted DCC family thiol-disulfide oxidoreductase YuxK
MNMGIRTTRCAITSRQLEKVKARHVWASARASSNDDRFEDGTRVRMLYDGECPLCLREVNMLRRRDMENNIKFVDIADPAYMPEENAGVTFEQAMERIHAVYPDGSFVVDIAAFKAFYEQVGLGWVYKATEVEWINKALNIVYGYWAKNRLLITGRPDMETILNTKKEMCGTR